MAAQIWSDHAFRVADNPGDGSSMTGDMSQWRFRPRQTLSQERSLTESPLASFRCSYWATVPCKNQTAAIRH